MSCIILVAEDDVIVRNVVRLLLQGDGHEVLVAVDGYEALELSRCYQGTIHLLLTDVRMPRVDGLELVEQILMERPRIKILLMSGNMDRDREEVKTMPFPPKPFSSEPFGDKVREVLASDSAGGRFSIT